MDKSTKGYESLVKGYGFRFDFKSANWMTYKANVSKWASYEDDPRLERILTTVWDDLLAQTREELEVQAPVQVDGKNGEAEVAAFEQLQFKHQERLAKLPIEMRKLQNKVGRMFLSTLGAQAATHVSDLFRPLRDLGKANCSF